MTSTVRLGALVILLVSFVATFAHPKKTDVRIFPNQHLPEIPGYIPVYIKEDGPPKVFKSHPLKTYIKPPKNQAEHNKRHQLDGHQIGEGVEKHSVKSHNKEKESHKLHNKADHQPRGHLTKAGHHHPRDLNHRRHGPTF